MEPKIRHLEMIRRAIDGASDNSLRIKGFAMLLLAGAMALALRVDVGVGVIPLPVAIVLLVIVVSLWLLDSFFIRQADLYSILYNEVQKLSHEEIDFSMEAKQYGDKLNSRYNEHLPFLVIASATLHVSIGLILIFSTPAFI